ncbi:MAG: adenylosuccinate lyase [Methanosarcinales archaeon]|jgi:adenylosuccinate lyase|nr:adenylosuccinate lyase [Methanosarcinales archaeon]
MPIHPIEFRYGTPEMREVWSQERRLKRLVEIEIALAKAEADIGVIPRRAAIEIEKVLPRVNRERVDEIESEINHEMMAVVLAISEQCEGDAGKWVHFGAASNDILDTATTLQFRDAVTLMEEKLYRLLSILVKLSDEYKNTVCCGRTHGQIGVPTTYGLRFAIWAAEMDRHIDRLNELKPRLLVGQMTGAVGTQASFGKNGIEIQKRTMEYLGIGSVDVSNQLIQRDRHAEFVMWMGGVATTLDKIGTMVRTLQRSEIGELEEGIGKKQVGSSTMPHKRNPIKSEQICGLARIVRGFIETELLNNTIWDERDLTNSSSERIVFPESCILTDHILNLGINVLENLRFNQANIDRNLHLLNGLNMAEAVMIELTIRGVGRQEAHEIVRLAAMKSTEENIYFRDALLADKELAAVLTGEEIENLVNPYKYIGTAVEQVDNLNKKLKAKHENKI